MNPFRLSTAPHDPELVLFLATLSLHRDGADVVCPLSKYRSCEGPQLHGGKYSNQRKPFAASHPANLVYHGLMVHNFSYEWTTQGSLSCSKVDKSTNQTCGFRFDRDDHLERHQDAKYCLGREPRVEHEKKLSGCTLYVRGQICGKKTTTKTALRRHLLSKMHGGPGARAGAQGGEKQNIKVSLVYIFLFVKFKLFLWTFLSKSYCRCWRGGQGGCPP